MSDGVKRMMREFDGNAGTQGDFLDECWEIASPAGLGTHGNAGTLPEPLSSRVPTRSRSARERKSPESTGQNTARSRVPGDGEHQRTSDTSDWAADARKVIDALPDAAVRPVLFDYFTQTADSLQRDRGLSRHDAEQQAFGLLLFQILKCGIDTGPQSTKTKTDSTSTR